MPSRRQYRYNELLLEEISLLIPGSLGDEDLSDITITRIEATQDLASAKVFFTLIGEDGPAAVNDAMERLKSVQGMVMDELSTLGLRRIPRLSFSHDKAQLSGQRVLDLLKQIHIEGPDDSGDVPRSADETSP